MIVQFSTGGRAGAGTSAAACCTWARHGIARDRVGELPDDRLREPPDFVLELAAKMRDHDVKPEIEIFDLAMLYNAADLVADGLHQAAAARAVRARREERAARRPRHARVRGREARALLPGATWTAAGIGRHQLT